MNKCIITDSNKNLVRLEIRGAIRQYRLNKKHGIDDSLGKLKEDLSKVREDVLNKYILPDSLYFSRNTYDILRDMAVFNNTPSIENIEKWWSKDNSSVMEDIEERNPNSELVYIRNRVNDDFLYKAYGLATEVREAMEVGVNEDLSECCFISKGKFVDRGTVNTNEALNDNMRIYQLRLFDNIVKYLRTKGVIVENTRMYDENKDYTGALEELDSLIDTYLSISSDDLSVAFNDENRILLDAYNASVLLRNFDSYLVLKYGDMIQIKDFNRKTNSDKYRIAKKTSKLQSNWRTSEEIDVSKETGYITKFLINAIPFRKWGVDEPVKGQYLTFLDYQYIVGKIKDLVNDEESTKLVFDSNFIDTYRGSLSNDTNKLLSIKGELRGKSLRYLIAVSVKDPKRYIHALFDILTQNRDMNILKYFSTDEKNKLYTISKGVFIGDDSIREINKGSDIDYYSYILLSCNSIYEVKHIQYLIDDSGDIRTRFLIDNQISKLQHRVLNSLNQINSVKFLNWGDYKDKYNIEVNYLNDKLKSITFTIPDNPNIKVTVNPGSDVKFVENGKEITDFSLKRELIKFADEILQLGINSLLELHLSDLMNGSSNMINDLASLAAKIILNQTISKEVLEGKNKKDSEDILKSIFGKQPPGYNQLFKEVDAIGPREVPVLKQITRALANLQGISTSVQVLDSSGNANSRLTLSRLATSFWTLIELLELNENSATNHFILWETPGLFNDMFIVKEFYNAKTGKSIPITRMSPYDLTYCGFIQDFVRGLLPNDTDNISTLQYGKILLYPFVCSDKNMMFRMLVDLNTTVNSKKLIDYTNDEFRNLISSELGEFYRKMFFKIQDDLSIVDGLILKEIERLGVSIYYDIPKLSVFNDIDNFINFDNLVDINNDNFVNFDNINSNFDKFNKWFYDLGKDLDKGRTPVEFINNIVSEYNNTHRLKPIRLIDQTHFINKKGNLSFNLSILELLNIFNTAEGSKEFWYRKEREIIRTLLTNKFIVNTTNSDQPELKYIRKNYSEWINKSGNMIIAKAKLGKKTYDITSNIDIIKSGKNLLDDPSVIILLNPLILKYNNIHFLFSQEYTNSTVGAFINHPAKKLPEEFYRSLNQIKRNVQASASLLLYILNLLTGIPDTYNISVIEDIKEVIPTVPGTRGEVTIYDGATWINPFISILENLSLGEQSVGSTKKPFIHFKDEKTGTGGIIKTAGFSLNNDNIKNSPRLKIMMKKMTNHVWLDQDGNVADDVDITKSWQGANTIYKYIYFQRGEKYYTVTDFKYEGNNTYTRSLLEVDINGVSTDTPSVIAKIRVNSNYDLWNFFGAEHSMSLINGKLQSSNASCENVVIAMNNAIQGTYTGTPMTLHDLWQPLKHSDIHYVVTEGAIKQGAANINPKSRFTDGVDYNFFRIKLYQAGIQLDKEHEADDSDVSLPTQIINACVALGYNYEQSAGMYNALYEITRINTEAEIKELEKLFENGENIDFRNIILRRVIEDILDNNSLGNNFVKRITNELVLLYGRERGINEMLNKIPISDNELYNRILSIINVYLTKSGIRLKMPGALLVLNPSHGIFKLYNTGEKDKDGKYIYDKYESFTEEKLRNIQETIDPVFDIEKNINAIYNLELGRSYIIIDSNGIEHNIELVNPESLKRIRESIQRNEIRSITEDVTKGRDLAGYNVRFKIEDGTIYLLWELDSTNMSYELYLINTIKDPKEKSEALRNFYIFRLGRNKGEDFENYYNELYNRARIYVNKLILNDLANLSSNRPKYKEQYEKLLSTRENTLEWYKKYANWVNIRLGLGGGDKIGGKTIDSENFEDINNQVQQRIENLYKVSINGVPHEVHDMLISPYEIILPKLYATKFGLDENTNLQEILNDEDYFLKQYIRNQGISVEPNQYSIAFKRSNGDHVYVLHKSLVDGSNLTKVEEPLTINDNGIWYKTNYAGELLHELDPNYEIYQDRQGREVIVSNDIVYYINNLHYSSIQLSDNLLDVAIKEGSDEIINNICRELKASNNNVAKDFYRIVTGNNPNLKGQTNNILELNRQANNISIDNKDNPLHGHIIKSCKEKYHSFIRSLDVIAGRTPAQCLQSFMAMRTVAFDNSDLNNMYVSIYLILLQGSDFDIDTASTLAFDISKNGILRLWSPYANITTKEMMEASEKLPFPNGQEIQRGPTDKIEDAIRIFEKYRDLINITPIDDDDNPSKVYVSLNLTTPLQIEQLGELLREIKILYTPSGKIYEEFKNKFEELYPNILVAGALDRVKYIYDGIADRIDNHNLYISRTSFNNRSQSVNNYLTRLIFDISNDPINMMQSHAPVDRVTEPWKEAASKSELSTESVYGNVFAYFNQFFGNLDSKAGVGIAANGQKGFYALKEYCNKILNEGTEGEQDRLLIRNIEIGGKEYKALANIMPTDPNTIVNDELRTALAENRTFNDVTLDLSALLSLAVDNAKDNILVFINATTKTLGMFTYGLSLGVPNMALIMMSRAANIYMLLLKTNSFQDVSQYSSSNKVFLYFDLLPLYLKSKYKLYKTFADGFIDKSKISENDFEKKFANWAKEPKISYKKKLEVLEDIRKSRKGGRDKESDENWNNLIDEIEEYTFNLDAVKDEKEQQYLKDLKVLAEGAEELRTFTSILALNQGLKTSNVDYLRQVQNLEQVIYNRSPKNKREGTILDVTRFAFDKEYRLDAIDEYEEVKHTFNILDAIDKCPLYLGYVLMLAMSSKAMEESYKYRTLRKMSLVMRDKYKISPEFLQQIDRGIIKACSDYIRKQWMLEKGISIYVPKGLVYFDQHENEHELLADMKFLLGTDQGDATFRRFMEYKIIPDLKKGLDNKFIKDLRTYTSTQTIDSNPTMIYSLNINMSPRTLSEQSNLRQYIAEFNKLSKISYDYKVTIYDSNGNFRIENKSIPVVDLFTYYAMIANRWTSGERSLFSILEEFKTSSGLISDFHNFEVQYDQSDKYLDDPDFIEPYVLPHASIYNARSNRIYAKNRETGAYEILKRVTINGENTWTTVKEYKDSQYFDRQIYDVDKSIVLYDSEIEQSEGDPIKYTLIFDQVTGNILSVEDNVSKKNIDLPIKLVKYKIENGEKVVDIQYIEAFINTKINC